MSEVGKMRLIVSFRNSCRDLISRILYPVEGISSKVRCLKAQRKINNESSMEHITQATIPELQLICSKTLSLRVLINNGGRTFGIRYLGLTCTYRERLPKTFEPLVPLVSGKLPEKPYTKDELHVYPNNCGPKV